jgi:hypothetical protein
MCMYMSRRISAETSRGAEGAAFDSQSVTVWLRPSGGALFLSMVVPPMSILLAPPRPSIDLDSWSLYEGERDCLRGVPEPRWGQDAALINPLSEMCCVKRRDSAAHIAMCALPRSKAGEPSWSTRPVTLTSRTMRLLSKQHADRLRAERLTRDELDSNRSSAVMGQPPSKRNAAVADMSIASRPTAQYRRKSVQLPPIQLDTIAGSPVTRRPHSSPVHTRNKPSPPVPPSSNSDSGDVSPIVTA